MNFDEIPINIGSWMGYQSFADKEQIRCQRENLLQTGLFNGRGEIHFIFTKHLFSLEKGIREMSESLRLADTETALEDEIFYTTKIEGAKTTRVRTAQIHNGSPITKDNTYSERMVKNAFEAVKLTDLLCSKTVKQEDLIRIWEVLTNGVRENSEIDRNAQFPYRSGEVQVGASSGAPFAEVESLMDKWIAFYNGDFLDGLPFLKSALLHFSFETIHPFCDGNGRAGRLFSSNYLITRGIESARAVSFSMEIDKNRTLYDAAFLRAENLYNDCTPFLEFLMESMYLSYEHALTIQREENNEMSDNSLIERGDF